jgi:hypothetical protein
VPRGAASITVRQAKASAATGIEAVIVGLRSEVSLGGIAKALTDRGIPTSRGTAKGTPSQIDRVMAQMSA